MDQTSRSKQAERLIGALLASEAWRATLYVDAQHVVRATRRWYRRGRKPDDERPEILVSFTRPNYRERDFIKACRKSGEPLPVKKVQLQFRVTK